MALPSRVNPGECLSREELADLVNAQMYRETGRTTAIDANYISKLERGEIRWPRDYRTALRTVLGARADADLGFRRPVRSSATLPLKSAEPPTQDAHVGAGGQETRFARSTLTVAGLNDLSQVERLREDLDSALAEGTMTEASLEDWEQTVLRYGRATRDRPAGVLLGDLTADLVQLRQALSRHHSASALRRLTRVTAHMAGLICLTLVKLDSRQEFRRWARTARLAAREAGDPVTHSWILAQEAYGHYYSADLTEAVDVARHAQTVTRIPCVGAALAAALEARAQAAMGRPRETTAALARAENTLSHLNDDELTASAFGYSESQLRFHQGNAYTHLHDVRAALAAQDRALELCAPGDYTDWAMTRLDRAHCLVDDGELSDAVVYATDTLNALTEPQRQGIITLRGHEFLNALPEQQRELPAGRDLREVLMLTTERREVEGT